MLVLVHEQIFAVDVCQLRNLLSFLKEMKQTYLSNLTQIRREIISESCTLIIRNVTKISEVICSTNDACTPNSYPQCVSRALAVVPTAGQINHCYYTMDKSLNLTSCPTIGPVLPKMANCKLFRGKKQRIPRGVPPMDLHFHSGRFKLKWLFNRPFAIKSINSRMMQSVRR